MNARTTAMNPRSRQTGATLVVGLILLLVLTVVGVSGMNTATMEVTMAGNAQFQSDAFQQAEDGIDIALAQGNFSTNQAAPTLVPWLNNPDYDRQSKTTYEINTPVPGVAYSTGSGIANMPQACHFDIVSVGKGARNASATHTQGFFVVGPCG